MAVSEPSYSVFIKRAKSLLILEKLAALLMLKHCKVLKFVLSGQAEGQFLSFHPEQKDGERHCCHLLIPLAPKEHMQE